MTTVIQGSHLVRQRAYSRSTPHLTACPQTSTAASAAASICRASLVDTLGIWPSNTPTTVSPVYLPPTSTSYSSHLVTEHHDALGISAPRPRPFLIPVEYACISSPRHPAAAPDALRHPCASCACTVASTSVTKTRSQHVIEPLAARRRSTGGAVRRRRSTCVRRCRVQER